MSIFEHLKYPRFPHMCYFCPTLWFHYIFVIWDFLEYNVKKMSQFAHFFSENEIRSQPVTQIPWSNLSRVIMKKGLITSIKPMLLKWQRWTILIQNANTLSFFGNIYHFLLTPWFAFTKMNWYISIITIKTIIPTLVAMDSFFISSV